MPPGCYYPGYWAKGSGASRPPTRTESARACQQLCRQVPDCYIWSWIKPSQLAESKTCIMKQLRYYSEMEPNRGDVISGLRHCTWK